MRPVLLLLIVVGLLGCSQKPVVDEPAFHPAPGAKRSRHFEPEARVEPLDELKNAYFDYDKSDLRRDTKEAIRKNAAWLKKHSDASVEIEGHCDERGTREYNYKLGEQRANRAKDYLVGLGISASRITTVSYGAIDGQSEKSWSRHRKAAFVIVYSR